MNIPTITQSKVSIDGSKIVSTNNNNHECVILNNVSLPSSINKDAGIHAKININIHNKTNSNIPNKENNNIPSNIVESLSRNHKVNI